MSEHTIIVIWIIKTFLYSSVCSCHLFCFCYVLTSCFTVPILAFNVLWISPIFFLLLLFVCLFFKRPVIFLILSLSSISLHCSFKNAFLSLLASLWNSASIFPFLSCLLLLFFPQLFVKSPQTTTLPSFISFSLVLFWSLSPVQCYEPLSIFL